MSREMLVMFGLLLLMLQMISCVDQTCRFNQTEICYAALGHKLSLQMVPDSQHYDATLKHHKTGDTTVDPTCKIKNDTIKRCDLYVSRSDVLITNGAVITNGVIREDSGKYTLDLYDSTGSVTYKELHVNVEAPIGSVKVSVNCTSGERRVFCSSDGDELIFSWTLNGLPQTEGNDSIGLDDETSGNISCGVKNHVSHGEKSIPLNYCTGSTTVSVTSALTNSTPASAHGTSLSDSNLTCTQTSEELSSLWKFLPVGLIVLGCVTGILVVLFITVYHIYKRKKHRKSTAAQVCVELIYADINHMKPNRDNRVKKADMSPAVDVEYAAVGPQTKRKERKEMKDEELQYGEVTFTPDGSNIQQQQQRRCEEQDECVYSQIQTHKLKH
ncbi:uncharacterized protein LOC130549808 isoform X2 [Triplophysa rosa]|uniref:uncharacterized protein LOC130549808 isoform X2 n=1 Tax=Triplophysa rosa TaxID=992332 RepID=UPI002545E72C|nr:uncharacterized protein LOC130549808 isoform X2 [Triplophysa rosa]